MELKISLREVGPQPSTNGPVSCPVAKSPQVSPNPQQSLERVRMKLSSEQRELKRAASQSHRLLTSHWPKAKKSPSTQARGPAAEGQ